MRLILLGPPGSGKGTQAKLLSQRLGLEHIGTGDLLREAIRRETPVGLQARPFVESGGLVPDPVVNDLIAERFRRPDRPAKFVMDGYPRTVAQAQAFDEVLAQAGLPLDVALLLQVDDAEVIQRLAGRWSCPRPGCKATYHVVSNPPRKAGVCDECGTPLVQRADDTEATVRARLAVYRRDTAELIPYYRSRGLLADAPGQGAIEEIHQGLLGALKR
jgi:adenylate kinase